MYNSLTRNALVNEILIPLVINKINIINELNLYEKYDIFFKQNVDRINIFELSKYIISVKKMNQVIQSSSDINSFLNRNKYIKIIIDANETYTNENNKYLLNNDIFNMNDQKVLSIYFNRMPIFKEILIKVFLEDNTDNEFIKYDILHKLNTNVNIFSVTLNNKEQLLIKAIIENVNENKLFKDKFLDEINNKIVLNLIKYTKLLSENCNKTSK